MYLQLPELISEIPSILDFDNKEETDGILGQLVYSTSRFFDAETFAPEEYYRKTPSDAAFSVRSFRTNGTDFFHVHHFTELESVTFNDANILSRCFYDSPGQTIRLKYRIWLGSPSQIQVSAKWGWTSVPEDVKLAVSAKVRIRLSTTRLGRNGAETNLGELEISELARIWDNAIRRYRELNRFAI